MPTLQTADEELPNARAGRHPSAPAEQRGGADRPADGPQVTSARRAAGGGGVPSGMRSETYASAVLECAAEAIVAIDPAHRIILANRAAERLFDHPVGQLSGLPVSTILPAWEDGWVHLRSPREPSAAEHGQDERHVERRSTVGRHSSGREFPVEAALSTMQLDGRQHLVAVVRDIRHRMRAEAALRESEERFHQAFSSAAVGMAIVSLEGTWLDVNTALCEQLGYSSSEMRGMTFADVTHPDDLDADLESGMRLLSGEIPSYVREKRYLHRSGATIWALLSASLVRDSAGAPLYFLVQVQDITERKAAEEALRRRSEELARSNTELEQYAYVASHDLQEPLRMVASYTELLARRYGGRLDERADKWIGYAADGARRLQTLIADLLSLSHIGSTGTSFAPVALDEVLARAAVPLQETLAESGGRVTRGPLPRVSGDASQLELVMRNLLSNAIKFRRPGQPPLVHVSAEPSSDVAGQWTISVRDNGIGMDMQFAERVFVIFQRLHTRGEFPGTGIGLAACRKIVERHGGRIWLESSPDHGTVVRFTLPQHDEE